MGKLVFFGKIDERIDASCVQIFKKKGWLPGTGVIWIRPGKNMIFYKPIAFFHFFSYHEHLQYSLSSK